MNRHLRAISGEANFSRVARPLESGGGGGNDGGMEARVAKLESTVEYIQRDIAEMRSSTAKMVDELAMAKADLAAIKVSLTHMPTTLQMWMAVGAVTLLVGGGLWWVVQQYLGPILARAAGA